MLAALATVGTASAQSLYWEGGLTSGPYTQPLDLCTHNNGTSTDLYGAFCAGVARWTGASWVQVGGFFDDCVSVVLPYDDGTGARLYAGGQFQSDGTGTALPGIAQLVGNTWQSFGGGLPVSVQSDPYVLALATFDDGNGPKLFIGGILASVPGYTTSILSWDGSNWGSLGAGLVGIPPTSEPFVYSLCVYDDGTGPALYVGGHFSAAGGHTANNIAKWDGSNWSVLGSGVTGSVFPAVFALAVWDDGSGPALFACGRFESAGGVTVDGLAKWNGTTWSSLPPAVTSPGTNNIESLATFDDGRGLALYVGGVGPSFTVSPGAQCGVARWDGTSWTSLGSGVSGVGPHYVHALFPYDDGQGGGPALWVSGSFGTVGGNVLADGFARWHGGCTNAIDTVCMGDGTFAICPCSNYGASPRGCANSAHSSGAWLFATGAVSPDTLVLHSTDELSASLSVVLQSAGLGAFPQTLGDGFLCLGGQVRRLYLKSASLGNVTAPEPGNLSVSQRSAALGDPIAPGTARYYQVWYRDGGANFCTPGVSNVTNGLRVVW